MKIQHVKMCGMHLKQCLKRNAKLFVKISLSIFGCAGTLLLCGLPSSCGVQALVAGAPRVVEHKLQALAVVTAPGL